MNAKEAREEADNSMAMQLVMQFVYNLIGYEVRRGEYSCYLSFREGEYNYVDVKGLNSSRSSITNRLKDEGYKVIDRKDDKDYVSVIWGRNL